MDNEGNTNTTASIHCSGVDDNRATGGGVTYWFGCDGSDYGLVRGRFDIHHDGLAEPECWVDCDGSTLDFPDEHMSAGQMRDAAVMADELSGAATAPEATV